MATARKKKPFSAMALIEKGRNQYVFALGGGTYRFAGSTHDESEYTVRLVPVEVVRQPTIVLKMPSNATEADLLKALAEVHATTRKKRKPPCTPEPKTLAMLRRRGGWQVTGQTTDQDTKKRMERLVAAGYATKTYSGYGAADFYRAVKR